MNYNTKETFKEYMPRDASFWEGIVPVAIVILAFIVMAMLADTGDRGVPQECGEDCFEAMTGGTGVIGVPR